jgi:glycine/D-amino acid oxidase-like deaminating enzyme
VPTEAGLVIGSTYEHHFRDAQPSEAASRALLARLARTIPALMDADLLDARAGIRTTVPTRISPRRLPMLGPLPGRRRVWAMLGLGSRGLLTAPLLAEFLARTAGGPAGVPEDVRLRIGEAVRT